MRDAMTFWLAKHVVDLLLWASVVLVVFAFHIPSMWHRWRCRHGRVWENQACDAICSDCGKNLGFIQTWRDKHRA